MTNILDNSPHRPADPILTVRKAPHAQVWSVWAMPEGTDAEEIFEGSSEQEARGWIANWWSSLARRTPAKTKWLRPMVINIDLVSH
jgi:hypothetical protein